MKNKKICSILLATLIGIGMCSCGEAQVDTQESVQVPTVTQAPVAEPTAEPEPTATPMPAVVDVSTLNSLLPGQVVVEGTDFLVDGERIYMNGVNMPWDKWNDFGGYYNEKTWSRHFAELRESGINSVRVWISCNGDIGMQIDENGYVTGATARHWEHLDSLFTVAEENGMYIMATLMSFDHFKDTNKTYESWRKMVQDEEKIDSYVENYVIPFCERYDNFNSLWSIDLCNEPDWIHENAECGKLSWDDLGLLFAKEAAAIHENSDVLVTIGFGMIKYNSEDYSGNKGSDKFLQSVYDNDKAYLDFYSTHYYEWEAPWYGFPFDKTPEEFKLDGTKPSVIGEFPAIGMVGNVKGSQAMTGSECYVNIYNNGWDGIMGWTSNGVDDCGSLEDFKEGAMEVYEKMNE